MKAKVLGLDGSVVGEIELPPHFEEPIRPDLIKRAVIAAQSHRLQPKGTKPGAGRNYTAEYVGNRRRPYVDRIIATGRSRLPRTKQFKYHIWGYVRNVPQAVKGPEAHPPKVETVLYEKINKKERKKAIRSAIAATADPELVKKRGHVFSGELPIVVVDDFENLEKTKQVTEVLKKIGVWEDIERAKEKKRWRAGKGKMRGRRYKKRKSVLLVVSNPEKIFKAARNLPGVDVVAVRNLNAEVLAPGGVPGRLTIWTKAALEALKELFW